MVTMFTSTRLESGEIYVVYVETLLWKLGKVKFPKGIFVA